MDGVVQGSRNDNAARLAGNLIAKGVSIEMVEFLYNNGTCKTNHHYQKMKYQRLSIQYSKPTKEKNQQAPPLFKKSQYSIKEPKDLYDPPGILKKYLSIQKRLHTYSNLHYQCKLH